MRKREKGALSTQETFKGAKGKNMRELQDMGNRIIAHDGDGRGGLKREKTPSRGGRTGSQNRGDGSNQK